MLTLRATRPNDPPHLRELLDEVWGGDLGAVTYHGLGRRAGLVAEDQGRLVGYGHQWRSDLHPTYTYVGVHVHPDWRGRGVGAALWDGVLPGQVGPLKAKTYAAQTEGTRFLQRRGLTLSVETHDALLDTSAVLDEQVRQWVARVADLGFTVVPMTELDGAGLAGLGALHDRVYVQAHRHDPAVPGILKAADLVGDDVVPEWMFVVRREEELAGVASVRLDEPRPVLGWCGVTDAFAAVGADLTKAVTGLAVQAAARAGVEQIGAELDAVDAVSATLLDSLPWQTGPIWQTFTTPDGGPGPVRHRTATLLL